MCRRLHGCAVSALVVRCAQAAGGSSSGSASRIGVGRSALDRRRGPSEKGSACGTGRASRRRLCQWQIWSQRSRLKPPRSTRPLTLPFGQTAGLSSGAHAPCRCNPGREHRGDIDDVLAVLQESLGQGTSGPVGAFDGPEATRPCLRVGPHRCIAGPVCGEAAQRTDRSRARGGRDPTDPPPHHRAPPWLMGAASRVIRRRQSYPARGVSAPRCAAPGSLSCQVV